MMPDFPAAHSMDTDWFAIDADGNIGLFDSYEGGAVPYSNTALDLTTLLVEMTKDLPHHLLMVGDITQETLEGLTLEQLQKTTNRLSLYCLNPKVDYSKVSISDCLLLLSSEEVITDLEIEKNDDDYGLRFTGEKTVVFLRECNFATLQRLVASGKILGGKEIEDSSDIWMELASWIGCFFYSCNMQQAYPYNLCKKPVNHLSIFDIPEHLHEAIQQNKFDNLKFSESKIIQPIEHMECRTWSTEIWIDVEGQEHNRHPTYD
jgi:hypothetical protein